MKIKIDSEGGHLVVTPVPAIGMCAVGRGATIVEALGNFAIAYQKELGLEIEVTDAAKPFEEQRRALALKGR